ncbi:hypothetical protein B0T26DRAFT_715079 [Lasiosphaeria miniovina]|uniref:Uncharacterized protein n=1 Tax=Lasiosphaeria miniovina TaxID=1954250 RepID=A0AA40ABE0_9PEZI|nr:uncharacterized protein B0T26DRAFT_715079 [Lasiosphaeria miniovina]KAK0712726.1 hypothetical protein B0T26DRAFT_715079 [Lasiosphaeria miniovina]
MPNFPYQSHARKTCSAKQVFPDDSDGKIPTIAPNTDRTGQIERLSADSVSALIFFHSLPGLSTQNPFLSVCIRHSHLKFRAPKGCCPTHNLIIRAVLPSLIKISRSIHHRLLAQTQVITPFTDKLVTPSCYLHRAKDVTLAHSMAVTVSSALAACPGFWARWCLLRGVPPLLVPRSPEESCLRRLGWLVLFTRPCHPVVCPEP